MMISSISPSCANLWPYNCSAALLNLFCRWFTLISGTPPLTLFNLRHGTHQLQLRTAAHDGSQKDEAFYWKIE
jgi:hypothetical protein